MSPIVNGKWYATMAEGYADSPFFKREVHGCVHDYTRFDEGRGCEECDRIVAAQEAERKREDVYWAERRARPWWRRLRRKAA